MNIEETKRLLDKYLDGLTTEAEEQQLRQTMNGEVPAELRAEKAMFAALARFEQTAEAQMDARLADAAEHRMSRMIDQWNRVENSTRRKSRSHATRWMAGVAAGMLVLVGVSFYAGQKQQQSMQPQTAAMPEDTYNDPRMAYKETEKALQTLSENLNKGIKEMEKIKKN